MSWKLYRHRDNPAVRFWARPIEGEWVFRHVGKDERGETRDEALEIRCPRNAAGYGSEARDLSPEECPNGGLVPKGAFLELYEEAA